MFPKRKFEQNILHVVKRSHWMQVYSVCSEFRLCNQSGISGLENPWNYLSSVSQVNWLEVGYLSYFLIIWHSEIQRSHQNISCNHRGLEHHYRADTKEFPWLVFKKLKRCVQVRYNRKLRENRGCFQNITGQFGSDLYVELHYLQKFISLKNAGVCISAITYDLRWTDYI